MKINIYLPDDLGERVRAAEGLNVSRVCQAALEQEVTLIAAVQTSTTDIEQAAVRLRKSRGDRAKELESLGYELGSHWAKTSAEWNHLVQLDKIGKTVVWLDRGDTADAIFDYLNSPAVEQILAVQEIRYDWELADPFARAFVTGACKTFDEIKKSM
jgi:post-segregation antitoxin (ccd killing protein)